MSLVDVEDNEDQWLLEQGTLETLGDTINKQITQRDSQNSTAEYNKISARIRIQLKQFENETTQLEKKLNVLARSGKLTADELERRRRILENLATKKVQLSARFQNLPSSSSSRSQLLQTAERNNVGGGYGDDDDEPIIDTIQFKAEQKQIIRQQDDSLDALSKVISRQKDIAIRIGDEVENQNEILDDLADRMDSTSSRVNSTTRNVDNVASKDSTFGYWIVIISLFVAIVVIGLL